MGIQKLLATSAEKCSAYAKAYFKESIMQTKPIKIPKKDEIGFICPNGNINFRSAKAALKYARTKCVNALKSKNPYEHIVEIKGSKIIYENEGKLMNVSGSNMDIADIVCHGHADTYAKHCTTAPSLDDFWGLANSTRQREDIVFNSAGEYYSMKKVRDVSYNKRTIIGILTDIDIAFYKHIFKEYPRRIQKKLDTAIKFEDDNAFYQLRHDYATFPGWNIPKNMVDRTHTFWLKHANELGLKVETNFSNFKDILA